MCRACGDTKRHAYCDSEDVGRHRDEPAAVTYKSRYEAENIVNNIYILILMSVYEIFSAFPLRSVKGIGSFTLLIFLIQILALFFHSESLRDLRIGCEQARIIISNPIIVL
jgi:hypothetical protein